LTAASFAVPLSPKPTVFGSRRTGQLKSSTTPPDVSLEDNVSGIAGRHFSVVADGSAYRVELISLNPGYCVRAMTEDGATRAELQNRGETCELQVRDMLKVAHGHVFQLLLLSENGQRPKPVAGVEVAATAATAATAAAASAEAAAVTAVEAAAPPVGGAEAAGRTTQTIPPKGTRRTRPRRCRQGHRHRSGPRLVALWGHLVANAAEDVR
jgi:hypothetical protein